jgi:amidohydrolase
MGAEDFAFMTQQAPGAMFFLGARIADENRPHHSPVFDIDEQAFPIGAAILAETACRLLQNHAAE